MSAQSFTLYETTSGLIKSAGVADDITTVTIPTGWAMIVDQYGDMNTQYVDLATTTIQTIPSPPNAFQTEFHPELRIGGPTGTPIWKAPINSSWGAQRQDLFTQLDTQFEVQMVEGISITFTGNGTTYPQPVNIPTDLNSRLTWNAQALSVQINPTPGLQPVLPMLTDSPPYGTIVQKQVNPTGVTSGYIGISDYVQSVSIAYLTHHANIVAIDGVSYDSANLYSYSLPWSPGTPGYWGNAFVANTASITTYLSTTANVSANIANVSHWPVNTGLTSGYVWPL